jgi:4'-phosphopantetheinyl transferase
MGKLRLHPGDVHVWRGDLAKISSDELSCLAATLSEAERMHARDFRFNRDRTRYIARRGVLRSLLGRYTGVAPSKLSFHQSPTGKSALSEISGPQWSTSHSGDVMLIALCNQAAVGIDVEKVNSQFDFLPVVRCFFPPHLAAKIAAVPVDSQAAEFILIWTKIEAILKGRGAGIANELKDPGNSSSTSENGTTFIEGFEENEYFHSFSAREGYIATLFAHVEHPSITWFDWPR